MIYLKLYHKELIRPQKFWTRHSKACQTGKLIKFNFHFENMTSMFSKVNCVHLIKAHFHCDFIYFCRWKNWVIRGIFTFIMISGFCMMIAGGPLALMITVRIFVSENLTNNNFSHLF